ncbi:MAG: glycosyltransferase [Bdellovibrionota bacterium]
MRSIFIVHETSGRPYYKGIEELGKEKNFEVVYIESSVLRLTIANIVKRDWKRGYSKQILSNLLFRIKVPFFKNRLILLPMAPFDFRMIWYRLLCRKNNVIYHTSWPYWDGSNVPRWSIFPLRSFVMKAWRKFFAEGAKCIVSVLPLTCKSILQNFYCCVPCHSIPHAHEFSVRDKMKLSLQDRDKPLKILFVGKLISEKGLENLVKISNLLPLSEKIQLTIVGDGKDKNLIQPALDVGAVWLGAVSDRAELKKVFECHDVLLVPSQRKKGWEELFGMVIIEAMSQGLTVIASNHIGPESIVNESTGYILEESQPEAWVEAILSLHTNRGNLLKLQEAAIAESHKYTTAVIKDAWWEVLKDYLI